MNNAVERFRRGFGICLLGCLLLLIPALAVVTPVVAQEPETVPKTSDKVAEKSRADTTAVEGSGNSVPQPPQETAPQREFEPTEEISEDLSIPFPVDI